MSAPMSPRGRTRWHDCPSGWRRRIEPPQRSLVRIPSGMIPQCAIDLSGQPDLDRVAMCSDWSGGILNPPSITRISQRLADQAGEFVIALLGEFYNRIVRQVGLSFELRFRQISRDPRRQAARIRLRAQRAT